MTLQHALNFSGELVVDNFAGGGGASIGIEQALGRPIDIAINHDAEAIAMHKANHPATRHLCESLLDVDPVQATGAARSATGPRTATPRGANVITRAARSPTSATNGAAHDLHSRNG